VVARAQRSRAPGDEDEVDEQMAVIAVVEAVADVRGCARWRNDRRSLSRGQWPSRSRWHRCMPAKGGQVTLAPTLVPGRLAGVSLGLRF